MQERFYFGDAVLPLFESGVPLLIERLKKLPDRDNITIAYPDEGAWKRFHYSFKNEGFPEVRMSIRFEVWKHSSFFLLYLADLQCTINRNGLRYGERTVCDLSR